MIKNIAAAFLLLTRFPIPWEKLSDQPPNIAKSLWAYPLVGLIISAIGAAVYEGATLLLLPSGISAILAVLTMILCTGALHEDGLADTADGFGGGRDKTHKLEIMRDSQIGAYGTISLFIILALRAAALGSMTSNGAMVALLVSGTVSRFMIVLSLKFMPPARQDGLAVEAVNPAMVQIIIAGIFSIIVAVCLLPLSAVLIISLLPLIATLLIWRLSMKHIGGMTGDVLGTIQQISESVILIGLLSYWNFAAN